jgi:hypothetical protein
VGPVPVVPCVGPPWIGAPPLGGIGFGAGVVDGAFGDAPVGGGVFGFVGVFVVGAVVPFVPFAAPAAPGESV